MDKKKNVMILIFLKACLDSLIQAILQKHILKESDQTLNIYDEATKCTLKCFCKSFFKILNHLMLKLSLILWGR